MPRPKRKNAGADTPKRRAAARATEIELDEEEELDEQPETPAEAGAPAASAADPRKIPRAKRLQAEEFETFLTNYPETDGTMFYLYRLEPKIDRTYTSGDDAETNIDKGKHQKFSLAWLRQTWGSGRYHVRFKDAGKQVCDSVVDINEYTEFPPILDVRELVDCDANRPFINNLIARNKAYRDGQGFLVPMDPSKTGVGKSGDGSSAEVVDRVLNFAERVAGRNQPGAGRIEEHAGLKAVDMMVNAQQEMMKQFFASTAGKGSGDGDKLILTLLTTMMNNQQAMMLKFMEMSSDGKGKGGAGGLTLANILDLLDRFGDSKVLQRILGRGDAAADVPWWQSLLDKIAPDLTGLVKTIAIAQANRPAAPAPGAALPAARPTAPAAAAPSSPAPAAPATGDGIPVTDPNVGIPASAIEPSEVITPHRESAAPANAEEEQRKQTISIANQMFNLIERGQSGDGLAYLIDMSYGFPMYASIAQLGKDGMLARMNAIPELATVIAMMKQDVETFIEEFLEYGKKAAAANAA